MWKCDECGEEFDEPIVREYYEPMPDGYHEKHVICYCPMCNSEFVSEVVSET